jgi:hypothetical protein
VSDQESRTIGRAIAELEIATGFDAAPVISALSTLAGVPAPNGDSAVIANLAAGFGKAAISADQVALNMADVASHDLPETWVGKTADHAADVVVATGDDIGKAASVLDQARKALTTLSEGFADARARYDNALDPLRQAITLCDRHEYIGARSCGLAAGTQLLAAHRAAADAGRDAARDLARLANQARAHAMKSANVDAGDRLVLTESAAPGGPHEENLILTDSEAQRAGQRLDAANAADRTRVEQLLTNAKSPQERAYLMKTLAAGHDVNDLTWFGNLIHDHGDDPEWLGTHLTPITNNSMVHSASVDYQGKSWTQGPHPTCVASSTVMGRAMIDPSYALTLTTGNKPDDPSSTSPEAFGQRLRAAQTSTYNRGRSEGGVLDRIYQLLGSDGMFKDESRAIANEDIGRYTGQDYRQVDTGSADDRRDIMPDLENAVDQGNLVPFQIDRDGDDGHEMMVIGHDGHQLEIYNPWGVTSWISEDAFIDGHLDQLDTRGLGTVAPDVTGVLLPHQDR